MKKTALSILAVSLLAACSTVKMHSWTDPGFKDRPMGKTMVLGIANSDSASRQYEAIFVKKLAENGVEAHSLHALLQKTDPVSKEQLINLLQKDHYDSILVTRKIAEKNKPQVVTPGFYPAYYNDYYGYYTHAYTLNASTVYVQNFTQYDLETNLYDVKTHKLVWSGRCTVYDDRSVKGNMEAVIGSVVKDLQKQGLIQPSEK